MTTSEPTFPSYPTIHFLVRFGEYLAVLLGLAPIVIGAIALVAGAPWWVAAGGIAIAPLVFLFVRSYVEMVRIIADTLLPR